MTRIAKTLECGGKRSATPLWIHRRYSFCPLAKIVSQSAVVVALGRRTPPLTPALLGIRYLRDDLTKLAKAMFLVRDEQRSFRV
jgi:hypothetical protein